MAGPRHLLARAIIAAAVAAAALAAWVSWTGRLPARALLPSGAVATLEADGAGDLLERVEGTRFAAAFEKSATAAWLARTPLVASLDAALDAGARISHLPLRRRHLLDILGREGAFAWYPAATPGGPLPWVAACRLSWRAWALASALRVAAPRVGGSGVRTREAAGAEILTLPGDGARLELFLRGRLLVAGSDPALVERAARCAAGGAASVTADAEWREVRKSLPDRGEIRLYARADAFAQAGISPAGKPPRAAGLLIAGGKRTEIHLFAEPGPGAVASTAGPALDLVLPPPAVLTRRPLLLYAARGPLPAAVRDLLDDRRRLVARRAGAPPAAADAGADAGEGFALVVADAVPGGFFPVPRGLAVVRLADEAHARSAVAGLFPPGARSALVAGATARVTRESIPLAGELELWGAAIGPRVVFATGSDLIREFAEGSAAAGREGRRAESALPPEPGWTVDTVSSVAVEKALPLLRRYAVPLSGMLSARYPAAPDLSRDIDLLGALSTVTAAGGATAAGTRGLVTLELRDLP